MAMATAKAEPSCSADSSGRGGSCSTSSSTMILTRTVWTQESSSSTEQGTGHCGGCVGSAGYRLWQMRIRTVASRAKVTTTGTIQ